MEEGAGIWSQLVSMMERRLGRLGPVLTTTVFVLAAMAVSLFCLRYIGGFIVDDVVPWVSGLDPLDVGQAVGFIFALVTVGVILAIAFLLAGAVENLMKQGVQRARARRDLFRVLEEGPDGRRKLILAIMEDAIANKDMRGARLNPTLPDYTPSRWSTTQSFACGRGSLNDAAEAKLGVPAVRRR